MSDANQRPNTLSVGLVSKHHQKAAAPVSEPAASVRVEMAVGTVVAGKYRLERALGVGGMGAVWLAMNTMTNAEVALKVLHAEVENPEALARFRREAHLAARLSHRGIVRVFDLLELEEGTLAMVMELLRGETLASRLDRERTLPPEEALDIALSLSSALAEAHAVGIVHRDLKPENVFLCKEADGRLEPKVLDFGISKMTGPAVTNLTGDGTLLGTPGYMSPEQARGDEVDARSDLFALGILLYEMISGDNPFTATTYNAVIAAILERDPEPLRELSPEVWAVLERLLEKKRSRRFSTAADFAAALRNAAGLPHGPPSLSEIGTASSVRGSAASLPDLRPQPIPNRTPVEASAPMLLPDAVLPRVHRRTLAVIAGAAVFGVAAATLLVQIQAKRNGVDADVATKPVASASAMDPHNQLTPPPVDPSLAASANANANAAPSGSTATTAPATSGSASASAVPSGKGVAQTSRPNGTPPVTASPGTPQAPGNTTTPGNALTPPPPHSSTASNTTTPTTPTTNPTPPTNTQAPSSSPTVHTIKNPGF